ncbi:MAG: lasso peptide isopeptide bond-forming cyclase [Methanobacterium sp.]
MSGITGIFLRDNGSVDPKFIKKMNKSIAHRGPDGTEVWVEGSVALGHLMLHTTPESLHEKLPLKDQTENMVITADARIDNREELMESLEIDSSLRIITDSELILKAYQKWGEKCPENLLGDFTFAIWDGAENKLFCARDHMGIKPFYYYLTDELFVFASEIKALFVVPEVPFQLNEEQVLNYLAMIYEDRIITSYKNIFRLPAASSFTITFQDSELHRYWELDPNYEIHFDSDEEYANAFLEIFTEAVHCRLRSAFPVGSMLSGGLDSSSIACTAQTILNKKGKYSLKTFSGTFETVPESDERYFIEKAVDSYNFDPSFIEIDKISPLKDIGDFLLFRDQPMIYPNTFMSWEIFRKASEEGVRIVFDGADGDAIVSFGNGFLPELFRTLRWKKLLFEINGQSKILNISSYKITFNILLYMLVPNILKRMKKFLQEFFREPRSKTRIINPDFSNRMDLIKRSCEIYKNDLKITEAKTSHYHLLNSRYSQEVMEFIDGICSPFPIELRHPFYDKRLVEFCLAIPTEQKLWNGFDRVIMRRAMNNILPVEIQWRKRKSNLAPNFHKNFLEFEQEQIEEIIFRNTNLIKDYVDIDKLQEIYKHYNAGDIKDGINVWQATILALWLQKTGFKS